MKCNYSAVLVEIVNLKLKEILGGNFILLVYDKSGQVAFERVLKFFKLNRQEEATQFIYVVYLDRKSAVIKIKDFAPDSSFVHMGVSQELLHYANSNEIKIIDIRKNLTDGQVLEIEVTDQQILNYSINHPCRLLGFIENSFSANDQYILCMVETEDNQIDYTRLYFFSRDLKNPDLEFYQYREVVQRELRGDPIVKIVQIINNKEYQFGMVLRKSKKVDFYWNYQVISTSEGIFIYLITLDFYDDIEINYESMFLRQFNANKTFQVDLKWNSRISSDVATEYVYDESHWQAIKYDLVKMYVRLFLSFSIAETSLFLAFRNSVIIYDILRKQWVDIKSFDNDVMRLYRTEKSNMFGDTKAAVESYVCVHTNNGKVQLLDSERDEETDHLKWKEKQADLSVPGQLEFVITDSRDFSSHFVQMKQNETRKVYGIKNDIVQSLESEVPLTQDSYLVKYFSQDEQEDFAVFNQKDGLLKVYYNSMGAAFNVYSSVQYQIGSFDKISGRVHSVIKDSDGKHLLLIDYKNLYVYNIEKAHIIDVKLGQKIQNLQLVDQNYVYALMNNSKRMKRLPGFYYQNLKEILSAQDETNSFKLQNAIVGLNRTLEYYRPDERLAFMNDYQSISIVPILHRNTINFYGIKNRDNYVTFLKTGDMLVALDYKNILSTYSVSTGKIKKQIKIKPPIINEKHQLWACDWGDYTYSRSYYFPKALIVDRTPVQVDEAEFYGDRLKCDLENNTAYMGIVDKQFFKFTYIEIISDSQVKVHFSFNHPVSTAEVYQRIFISDDQRYMLERLVNQRVFIYERVDIGEGMVKWKEVARMKTFPKDISDFTGYFYLFSPNLMYFLDFDKRLDAFQIKHTLTQEIYKTLPKGLLSTSEKNKLARKFMWIDNNRIRIVSDEGIEKVIDVHQDLKEISYGTIPMLHETEYIGGHYFFDPLKLDQGDNKKRLRRKYQEYFRAFYVDEIRSDDKLYEILFKVDFSQQKPLADLSFTYFHWKLSESLTNAKKKIKLKRFSKDEIKLLLLNIFPKGNTVLHFAYKNVGLIKKFYQFMADCNEEDGMPFEIPFIGNFAGQTPLHKCLLNQNFKSADILLQSLASTPLDSHSRAILDIMPQLIGKDLSQMKNYLDSRFLQTQQLKSIRKGSINYRNYLEDYAVDSCQLWPDTMDVEKKLFKVSPLDAEIKLEFLDLPTIHSYNNKVSSDFFTALAGCDNMDIFASRSIQVLIDYKWPLARQYTLLFLFTPFLFYSATWVAYSNVFNGQLEEENEHSEIADLVLSAMLYVFSIYFLFNECRQLINQGLSYLLSFWNYSDLLPPCFIITVISLHLSVKYNKAESVDEVFEPNPFIHTIHSIASLLMWAKFLYFLRIFESTGYLVRMVTVSVFDMKIFLLILFIFYFGFGEAFLRISENSDEEAQFIDNYAYAFVYAFRVSIGDMATDTFDMTIQPVTLWILWVISALITSVVMLNLLVAIIGESFNAVNENQKQASYQVRAQIIAENAYLIPSCERKKLQDEKGYIIIATEVEEQDDDPNKVEDQISNIEEAITKAKSEILEGHQSLENKINLLLLK